MLKDLTMTEGQASALSAQLWRYYDIEADVQTGYTQYSDGVCRIFYEGESGMTCLYAKIRFVSDTVEDLYLVVGDEVIEPTTTKEEQELR